MENIIKSTTGLTADQANDFVNRVTTGDPTEGYTADEAKQMARAVLPNLTPEQLNQALAASAKNLETSQSLSASDRTALNKMLEQRQAGKGLVDITRSGDSKAAGTDTSSGDGGGLDDVLGGLLGGLLGGTTAGSTTGGGSSDGGGGLGDILGQILGGGADTTQPQTGGSSSDDSGGGLGDAVGDLLGSPLGKALMAGAAAFAMKQVIGGDKS